MKDQLVIEEQLEFSLKLSIKNVYYGLFLLFGLLALFPFLVSLNGLVLKMILGDVSGQSVKMNFCHSLHVFVDL